MPLLAAHGNGQLLLKVSGHLEQLRDVFAMRHPPNKPPMKQNDSHDKDEVKREIVEGTRGEPPGGLRGD